MTVTQIIPFSYRDHQIRSVKVDSESFFIATDVCKTLEIGKTYQAIAKLDNDEKCLMPVKQVSGQTREVWLINESGLYSLIFRSNKPEAQIFRKWVTSEVLPALRKSGSYQISSQGSGGGTQLTLPFLDADYYIDQVKREMLEVALRVSPGSRAGKFLKLIKPLVYGAQKEQL